MGSCLRKQHWQILFIASKLYKLIAQNLRNQNFRMIRV